MDLLLCRSVFPQCKLCRRPARSHSCSTFLLGTGRCDARCCTVTGARVSDSAENCGFSRSCCAFDKVVDAPVLRSSSTRFGRPVIMQRRQLSYWRCLSSCSSPELVDIQLCSREWYSTWCIAAVKGLFDAFCVIFRAPPVVPELSASFSSFRALTTMSARGLQGVPESPGV